MTPGHGAVDNPRDLLRLRDVLSAHEEVLGPLLPQDGPAAAAVEDDPIGRDVDGVLLAELLKAVATCC